MNIHDIWDLNNVIIHGPYAWPGGYPKLFLMADGETCCFECIKDNRIEVFAAAPVSDDEGPGEERSPDPQWWPVAVDINWEDPALYCAHCGGRIESAYAEEEVA